VVGGAAGAVTGAEAVDHAELVQDRQAVLGGVAAGKGQVRELSAGEHPMLVQQPAQGPVAVGDPPGEGGQPRGGAAPTGCPAHAGHHRSCHGWAGAQPWSRGRWPAGGMLRPAGAAPVVGSGAGRRNRDASRGPARPASSRPDRQLRLGGGLHLMRWLLNWWLSW
jgi:hypothetical protein